MAGLTEERLRVVVIVHALKAVGIRVKTWKNIINGDSNGEQTFRFLVEACRYLSQHLETEGLFRKTGSLSRIRALRNINTTNLLCKNLLECVSSHSPLEEKCRKDPISTTSKKRNHIREQQKSLGYLVVENEMDDDPDLLNCCFAENPNDCVNIVSEVSCIQRQDSEQHCDDECWIVLENENFVQLGQCEVIQSVTQNKESQINASREVENELEVKQLEEQPRKESKKVKNSSKNRSRPRRSISLPEVTLESCTDEMPEFEKEVGRAETEMDNTLWPMFASPTLSNE
ncbi:hypothetical protein cypCar_00020370 [Cyprinus carpio]|nr:hypothetical protein cypCar_00020370 [Cyprinus carpio]